jgi:hypothetical protein
VALRREIEAEPKAKTEDRFERTMRRAERRGELADQGIDYDTELVDGEEL